MSPLTLSRLFGALMILLPVLAMAQERARLEDVSQGTLLLKTGQAAAYEPAPLQDTDARIDVTGPIARTRLRQRFRNPGSEWAEALYAFPLPEDAAVDRLRMRIGERIVEGEIQEKAQARKTYDAARKAGKRAALVEQKRPNLFTTAVANIPPQGEVTVEIEYQQELKWRSGEFRLRLPLAITPRYTPAQQTPITESRDLGGGWSLLPGELPNSADLSPLKDGRPASHNPVTLQLALRAGFPIGQLESAYHGIVTREEGETTMVELDGGPVPADRDFELRWSPAAEARTQGAFFVESTPAGDYGLLMLMPPESHFQAQAALTRELIFVIDTSGSMGGASMRQAREALLLALDRLNPRDAFNVIEFDNNARALFSSPMPADGGHLGAARSFVQGLRADGGTEMLSALQLAFAQGRPQPGALRQIVFITDGAIGNEAQLFAAIHQGLGDARLFTVGIGSAPNTHFMTEAAHFGRGSSTLIGQASEVRERMQALFERLERAALTDLQLELPVARDAEPAKLPDLYAGEPVSVVMKLDGVPDHATLRGRIGNQAWTTNLGLQAGQEQQGLGILWARRRIQGLMREQARGQDRDAIRQQVTALALQHHLVSAYTSLVAVDKTPARPAEAPLKGHALKTNLPAGWKPGTQSVPLAAGATPSLLYLLGGLLSLVAGSGLRRLGRA